MPRWEEGHCVFWVSFVASSTTPAEFQAGSILARVGSIAARDTVDLPCVSTHVGPVRFSTGSASVLFRQALASEMSPLPAFYTLYWFHLLLCGSDSRVTDAQTVSDEAISRVYLV